MRILILGSGLMGPAAAYNCLLDPATSRVTLCDVNPELLREGEKAIPSSTAKGRFSSALLDVGDQNAAADMMSDFDVVISALPHTGSAQAIRASLQSGTPVVDLARPPEEEVIKLAGEVRKRGNLVVLGCGLDPGLAGIMCRHLAGLLDRTETLHSMCGGIPEKPTPPLGYKIVYGGWRLPLQESEALVLEEGRLRGVPRYSAVETVRFEGIGEVEAFDEGFMPGLLDLPKLKGLRVGTRKTLRWPGYAARVNVLRELGLLGETPLEVEGTRIPPRDFVNRLLAPHIRMEQGERDLTLFRVEATGEKNGRIRRYRVEMVDRYDRKLKMTSMARVTAFTAAIVARMVIRGEVKATGLNTPETVVFGAALDRLLAELAAQGVHFEMTTERVDPLR